MPAQDGATPLHLATAHVRCVEALLLCPQACLNRADRLGRTVLHVAIQAQHEATVHVLLRHGVHKLEPMKVTYQSMG